jgi:hypothetical protein
MPSFKSPTFQDRAGQAASAKREALERLRLRPAPSEAVVAKRKQSAARKAIVRAEKALTKKEADELAKSVKAQAVSKANLPVPTEAERKAGRDARYAARKRRR